MDQLAIDFRARGEAAAEACAYKAERVSDFDREGAAKFILGYLARHGETAGEILVEQANIHGYRAHDNRAFGAVFQKLSRRGMIRCVGFCMRRHGNGTAGGRIWMAVR